jgi:hypothetical protein
MLLGINAHVQRDMPFMIASVGLRTPAGASHKHDHDIFSNVLNSAYARVTDTITQRFDPSEGFIAPGTNALLGLTGNVTGDELVQGWREQVWRNAEALVNSSALAVNRLVRAEIETNAATWAAGIAGFQLPSYRSYRDAYCARHNTGPLKLLG